MSYVRWSTQVRDDCERCGGTCIVPDGEFAGLLCTSCTSCWYIYWSVGDYISVNHAGGCSEHDVPEHLDFEDAPDFSPPEDCPMRDVAITAVMGAYRDWKMEQEPEQ